MDRLLLIGRILFGAIFVFSGPRHFSPQLIAYGASAGVPAAGLLVPLAGIMAFVGGVCIILGWRTRFGAWLLIGFLVPVTLVMHRYWGLADPAQAMLQQANFWKNVSMLGGALAFTYFGSGPYSLDSRRRARRAAVPSRERPRELSVP